MARGSGSRPWLRQIGRALALVALCALALQLTFALRVAAMAVLDPHSTAFQRSEAWRLLSGTGSLPWRQQWVEGSRISPHLARAVIASEDAAFAEHGGFDWEALERAWARNARAQEQAARTRPGAGGAGGTGSAGRRGPEQRLVGGSTITQQLAKNLFLSGERTVARKAQEFVITLMLEALLDKRRILEIYLNSVEWGAGVFGAQAAAQHYYRTDAARLGPEQAARLAVMLPAPKRFERLPGSPYLAARTASVVARMGMVTPP
jgi:monofunctional biosynthetic peptidoglycan transglycosylase